MGIFYYPHLLNFYLQMSKKSFIINAEGNRDTAMSPLPQTETYVRWFISYTSYPLLAIGDSFFLSISGCCDYLCKSKRQIPLREALKFLTYS